MKVRLIHQVSARAVCRIYEGTGCPSRAGSYHLAERTIDGMPDDYDGICRAVRADNHLFDNAHNWPTACVCGYAFTKEAHRSVSPERIYNTASGKPEPGDMFFEPCTVKHMDDQQCFHWDNCDGLHLHAICPNGKEWDIDSRANNCTLPDERTHRCWVRSGEPPNVTAGKTGHTCSAGAGSIQAGDYHGHLIDGEFRP